MVEEEEEEEEEEENRLCCDFCFGSLPFFFLSAAKARMSIDGLFVVAPFAARSAFHSII